MRTLADNLQELRLELTHLEEIVQAGGDPSRSLRRLDDLYLELRARVSTAPTP